MSITGITGLASSEYTSPYSKRRSSSAPDTASKRYTGPDTVSFSEKALQLADDEEGTDKSSLQPDTARNGNSATSLTDMGKKNMFAMLLESLFLADLEENATANAAARSTEGASEDEIPRQQPQAIKKANPLEDSGKVAEIKKALSDFTTGKADVSDLATVMAVGKGAGTGQMKSVASKNEASSAAGSSDNDKKNTLV